MILIACLRQNKKVFVKKLMNRFINNFRGLGFCILSCVFFSCGGINKEDLGNMEKIFLDKNKELSESINKMNKEIDDRSERSKKIVDNFFGEAKSWVVFNQFFNTFVLASTVVREENLSNHEFKLLFKDNKCSLLEGDQIVCWPGNYSDAAMGCANILTYGGKIVWEGSTLNKNTYSFFNCFVSYFGGDLDEIEIVADDFKLNPGQEERQIRIGDDDFDFYHFHEFCETIKPIKNFKCTFDISFSIENNLFGGQSMKYFTHSKDDFNKLVDDFKILFSKIGGDKLYSVEKSNWDNGKGTITFNTPNGEKSVSFGPKVEEEE